MSFPPATDSAFIEHDPAMKAPIRSRAMNFTRIVAGGSPPNRRIRKNACSGERLGRLAAGP